MSYIVTQGTVAKNQLFNTFVTALQNAGWTNISSSSSADKYVMNSTGTSGSYNLVFQLSSTTASQNSSYDTVTSNGCNWSYRLIGSYTPGASGSAGTVGKNSSWRPLPITSNASDSTILDGGTSCNYKIFANKNFCFMTFEYPSGTGANPTAFWIGMPDDTYCNEHNSTGLLVASMNYQPYSQDVMITGNPSDIADTTTDTYYPIYCQLSPYNPNSAGEYMMSDLYYGNTSIGLRGKLDGIYMLPNQNILSGDTITIGTSTFYVIVGANAGSNSFPTIAIAVQTA